MWFQLSDDERAAIAAIPSLAKLSERLTTDAAEIRSPEARACMAEAYDDDKHTPEWDGPVSFCDDGKAWVMTWELVDDPNQTGLEDDEAA